MRTDKDPKNRSRPRRAEFGWAAMPLGIVGVLEFLRNSIIDINVHAFSVYMATKTISIELDAYERLVAVDGVQRGGGLGGYQGA